LSSKELEAARTEVEKMETYDQSGALVPWHSEERLLISGVELSVAPPIELNVESPELRYQKLTHQ
jgi:hypothetical protein